MGFSYGTLNFPPDERLQWTFGTSLLGVGVGQTTGEVALANARARVRFDGAMMKLITNTDDKAIVLRSGDVTAETLSVLGVTQDASTAFKFDSAGRAILVPRLSTATINGIATPLPGMVVFDSTTNKLKIRGAAAWETVTSV